MNTFCAGVVSEVFGFLNRQRNALIAIVLLSLRHIFIQKEVDEKDLRQNHLSITQKGIETSKQCEAIAQSLNHKMFDGFSEEELDALENYLERLIHNLSSNKKEEDISLFSIIALENQLSIKESGGKND